MDTAFHPRPIQLSANLDRYLAESERRVSDVVPGTERTIVWANAAKAKTPLSLVYLHGFSASRQEISPVCERLASRFGANLYYARLTGHGLNGNALASASVSDWLNDAVEALAIGKQLGERVVVIGTSTGGTLAAWLALQPAAPDGCVLLSPNFVLKDHRATLLTWPWSRQFVPLFFGAERHRVPQNDAERRYWTTDYPTVSLLPMAGLMQRVNNAALETIRAPVLVICAPDDQVVDSAETEKAFARIGSPKKKFVAFTEHASRNHHVLAGDIIAPANTDRMVETIASFLAELDLGKQAEPVPQASIGSR